MKVWILLQHDILCQSSHIWGVYSTKDKAEHEKEYLMFDMDEHEQLSYWFQIIERELE